MASHDELFNYSKEVLRAEIESFNETERKAGQYFSVFGFLLSVSGVIVGVTLNRFIPPHGYLETILFLLGVLLAASLLVTGLFLFRALGIASLNLPPLNSKTIEYFKGNNEKDIHEKLSVQMSDAVRHNREVVKRKTDSLKIGYSWMIITALLLALFGIILVAEKWHAASTQPVNERSYYVRRWRYTKSAA